MSTQQIQTRGIYHGLPVFPTHQRGLTAIVTGANGISGYYMLRVLAQAPERWSKIYCLSRRPPAIADGLPPNAEHVALDFLKEPDEIAEVLKEKGVRADYVFFFSYIQPAPKEGKGLWSDAEEMVRVNKLLLDNFLEALTLASIKPKRFMLQTGAKNYGTHLGPTRVPQEESDPRVELEPNFYYDQEDSLFAWCREHSVGWNVAMPSFIVGAVPDAAMNAAYPLAVYAAVCTHLRNPLDFPGSVESWQMTQVASSAMLNAYLEEWSVLTEKAADKRFNACDSSAFAWEKFWPRVAAWYGIEWKGPMMHATETAEAEPEEEWTEVKTRYDPPPRGYGGPGTTRFRYRMTEWARRPEVAWAWKELAERHDLVDKGELRDIDRVFGFLDGMVNRAAAVNFSMDKSRKLGWHGFVDSAECFLETFRDLAKLRMIPPVPEVKVELN